MKATDLPTTIEEWRNLERYRVDAYSEGFASRIVWRGNAPTVTYERTDRGYCPFTVLGAIAHAMADRAELVLPSAALADSLPLLMALAQGDRDGIVAGIKATGGDRLTAEQALAAGEMVRKAGSGEMFAADTSTLKTDGAPTRVARRTDGTVKGRLHPTVIGRLTPWNKSVDDSTHYGTRREHYDAANASLIADGWQRSAEEWELRRMESPELISRANVTMRISGDYVPMIGTETGAWSDVVEHEPESVQLDYLTVNGAPVGPIVFAPYGAGDSIAGSTETAKRRTGWQRTNVTYPPRPIESVALPMWTHHGAAWRVVKRYATTAKLVSDAPRATHVGGRRGWVQPAARVSVVKRDANVRTLSHDDAVSLICDEMRTAIDSKRAEHKITAKTTDGYRFTAALTRDARAVRVTVSHDGHVTRRSVRTVAGVASTLNKHRAA